MPIDTRQHHGLPAVHTGRTAAGTNQASASKLGNNIFEEFSTVASGTGAVLPSFNLTPSQVLVSNGGANTLLIYPPLGSTIDNGSANASVSITAGTTKMFWASSPTNWYSFAGAASGGGGGTPGGSSGQIQYDNAGSFGGFTASGDATINTSTGAVAVASTGGVAFGPYATLADAAQGDIPYFGASAPAALAHGTAGNPLQTGGSAANPSWNSNLLLPSAGPVRSSGGVIWKMTGAATAFTSGTQGSILAGATATGTLTIPANSLIAGQAIRIELWGTFGCTASTPTMTMYLMLGSNIIGQTNVVPFSATAATNSEFYTGGTQVEMLIPTIGVSGKVAGRGGFAFLQSTSVTTSLSIYQGANLGTGTMITVDTTANQTIDIQAKWGTTNAANTMQVLAGFAELIG